MPSTKRNGIRTSFRRSFVRDLKKVRSESLRRHIREAIEQVEVSESLREIPDLVKMSGASGFYRIRVGDYRIGVAVEDDDVEFVRCLHRRDIYRYFP